MIISDINSCKHSFIIPYHSNKELLFRSLKLLYETLPQSIKKEVIVVANNYDENETNIEPPYSDCRVISVSEDLLYAKAVNMGVDACEGDVVILCDEDLFYLPHWYEPLFEKFNSSDDIGSVGCKLLNPNDNTILDFGIDFALYNNVHPTRGLPWNHPYSMFDREVQGLCSAILMTTPSMYKKVGGMDPSMAYLCCDTDFGIKVNQLNLKNWVVASSVVYHKGPSSNYNTKNTRYSYLASDARAMFYAKDYNIIQKNLPKWVDCVAEMYTKEHKILNKYILINLSSYSSDKWFIEVLKNSLNINYYSVYKYNPKIRNNKNIQLYDYISLDLIDSTAPIIYFVDEISALRQNAVWKRLRNTEDDIVVDINGSILAFNELESMFADAILNPVYKNNHNY